MAGTSGITGRSIKHGSIGAYHLTDSLRKGRYFYESFGVPASIQSFGTQAAPTSIPTLPSALADQVSRIFTGSGNLIEYYQATAQAALPLAHATKGWDIAGDQLANESLEMVFGGNRATNPLAMVVGTDQNFFISATVEFTDADGADQFLVGWRKVENYIVPTSFLTTWGRALHGFLRNWLRVHRRQSQSCLGGVRCWQRRLHHGLSDRLHLGGHQETQAGDVGGGSAGPVLHQRCSARRIGEQGRGRWIHYGSEHQGGACVHVHQRAHARAVPVPSSGHGAGRVHVSLGSGDRLLGGQGR